MLSECVAVVDVRAACVWGVVHAREETRTRQARAAICRCVPVPLAAAAERQSGRDVHAAAGAGVAVGARGSALLSVSDGRTTAGVDARHRSPAQHHARQTHTPHRARAVADMQRTTPDTQHARNAPQQTHTTPDMHRARHTSRRHAPQRRTPRSRWEGFHLASGGCSHCQTMYASLSGGTLRSRGGAALRQRGSRIRPVLQLASGPSVRPLVWHDGAQPRVLWQLAGTAWTGARAYCERAGIPLAGCACMPYGDRTRAPFRLASTTGCSCVPSVHCILLRRTSAGEGRVGGRSVMHRALPPVWRPVAAPVHGVCVCMCVCVHVCMWVDGWVCSACDDAGCSVTSGRLSPRHAHVQLLDKRPSAVVGVA